MTPQAELAAQFLSLHIPGEPLLLPNPWDAGTAKLFAALGFKALATTSSGFAATLGRLDGHVTRDEAIAHAAAIVAATDIPVSADLEHGYGDAPDACAATVTAAVGVGLAGCSIEDSTGNSDAPIYDKALAVERVTAAVEAAHRSPGLVLTARAENQLHGVADLADTIGRLQAFQEAGADVLYAPGLTSIEDIRAVVTSVDRPVNVLIFPGVPGVAELAAAGVARISVGGAFAYAALDTAARAGRELLESGTYSFAAAGGAGRNQALATFS